MEDAIRRDDVKVFAELVSQSEYTNPIYLNNDWIFHWIYLYEATNVLSYLRKYIKTHPTNVLSNGAAYRWVRSRFNSYKAYRIIKSGGNHKNKCMDDICMHPILLWRIIKMNCSEKIVGRFRDMYFNDRRLRSYRNHDYNEDDLKKHVYHEMSWKELIVSSLDRIMNYYSNEIIGNMLTKFSFEEKVEFLTTMYSGNYTRHTMFELSLQSVLIASNDMKTYEYLKIEKKLGTPTSVKEYVYACKYGNLDTCVYLLNEVTGLKLVSDLGGQLLDNKKLKTVIRSKLKKKHVMKAYRNSLKTNNGLLMEFNAYLLKCYPNVLVELCQEMILSDVFNCDYVLNVREVIPVLDNIIRANVDVKVPTWLNVIDHYLKFFACCSLGFVALFRNHVQFEDLWKPYVVPTLEYFDKLDKDIEKRVKKTKVLLPPLLKIIASYAQY
jgi:hypothetical protein